MLIVASTLLVLAIYCLANIMQPRWVAPFFGNPTTSSGAALCFLVPLTLYVGAQAEVRNVRPTWLAQLCLFFVASVPTLAVIIVQLASPSMDQIMAAAIVTAGGLSVGCASAGILANSVNRHIERCVSEARFTRGVCFAVLIISLFMASLGSAHRLIFESGWLMGMEFAAAIVFGMLGLPGVGLALRRGQF